MLKPVYMHLLPWDEIKALTGTYTKKRPKWIIPVAIVGILLVTFTWYKELATDVPYSIIITLIFSLTIIKAFLFLFDYEKFRRWISGMVSEKNGWKKVVLVNILTGIFGLIVVVTSLLIY